VCLGLLLAAPLVVLSERAARAAPTRYEAEAGAAAQFTVTAPAAGTATVGVRFANGTTSARPANVIVNGSTVQSVPLRAAGPGTPG
jgi:hypothetical protein